MTASSCQELTIAAAAAAALNTSGKASFMVPQYALRLAVTVRKSSLVRIRHQFFSKKSPARPAHFSFLGPGDEATLYPG